MSPLALILPLLFGASAALLASALLDLRERQLALRRASGMEASHSFNPRAVLRDALQALALRLERKLPPAFAGLVRAQLAKAGRGQEGPGETVLAMGLGLGGGFAVALLLELGAYSMVFAFLGAALPLLRLHDQAKRREQALRKDLPDSLDLLQACVAAGLGFDQALSRVALRLKPGAFKKELEIAVAQLSLGASRKEALSELALRCALEELSQAVSALLQSERRGVPLTPALEAQSAQIRVLKSLRVKKLAAEAPLKMLFPLMAFILPVVFLVLFGPIFLQWKEMGF